MNVSFQFDEANALLCVELGGATLNYNDCEKIGNCFEEISKYKMEKLLIDYSRLYGDVGVEGFFDFAKLARPLFANLQNVKTAAVLNDKLSITAMVISIMFNMGVWVAIFPDRDEALAWLLSAGRRPPWMPDAS